jgi:hypothetical protein
LRVHTDDRRFFGHVFDGVFQHIAKNLHQLLEIGPHRRGGDVSSFTNSMFLLNGWQLFQAEYRAEDRIHRDQVHPLLAMLQAGELQELVQHGVHMVGVAQDDFQKGARLFGSYFSMPTRVSAYPLMDVSGVRSSCDTLATKSRRICSTRLISVMS